MAFTKIVRKTHDLLHPVKGEEWCLHRVVQQRSRFDSNRDLEITPFYLEQQILQCKNNGYSFVSIDELLFSGLTLVKKNKINISFDDGFKDIYTNAFPIFKKYSIPFTIYLTTDFPDGKADLWWIQLENCSTSENDFEYKLKLILNSGRPMAEEMHRVTKTSIDYDICLNEALNWTEIKEMVESGLCTLGSHTVSHPGLTRISIDDCKRELLLSKERIERMLPVVINHFSYPHSMISNSVREMVAKCGYLTAVKGYGGSIRVGDDSFCLNRKYIVQK